MAITTISELRNSVGAGARSNLYKVTLPTGALGGDETDFGFLCKAAQLPGSTLGVIDIPFMAGRRYKLAGDRTFADWTTTILADQNQKIRQALEDLQREYSPTNYNSSAGKTRNGSVETDFNDITVEQLDTLGKSIYKFTLKNCWPSDISSIDLSYDSTDTLEEFTVTWSYDYFVFDDTP
jgi:hypothetical protein